MPLDPYCIIACYSEKINNLHLSAASFHVVVESNMPPCVLQPKQTHLPQLFLIGFAFQTPLQLCSLDLFHQLNILEMRGPELDTSLEVLPHLCHVGLPPDSYPKTFNPLVTIILLWAIKPLSNMQSYPTASSSFPTPSEELIAIHCRAPNSFPFHLMTYAQGTCLNCSFSFRAEFRYTDKEACWSSVLRYHTVNIHVRADGCFAYCPLLPPQQLLIFLQALWGKTYLLFLCQSTPSFLFHFSAHRKLS